MTSGVSERETRVATRSPAAETEGGLGADLLDDADEHAARAGDRVLHLARGSAMISRTSARIGVAVARVLVEQLTEARGVEVEPLDPDPDLVGLQRRVGVEAMGGLGRTPAGSRTRCSPTGEEGRVGHRGILSRTSGEHAGDLPVNGWLNGKVSAYPRRHDRAARRPCGVLDGPVRRPALRDAARPLVEPDWTRFVGWADVTEAQWRDVQWQRAHCVKNIKQLRELVGDLLEDRSTPTSSATRPSGRRCRCSCRRR